ncbi:adenosylmethionine--8-amino-7-oxononanoate transaminase [Pseudaquabacterium rugosum]|uniref:Adenosylmethionine-8-amino-7-oxononanoate aminotransferase n=1 Tax=Pseudaquabacterium rugosum TaxID=2984194 RepID=A0ABU9BCZ9_9BURK
MSSHSSAPAGTAADWAARSRTAVWHPCTQMARLDAVPPLAIVRGDGPWLYDADGAAHFDSFSSWWVNLFGHSDAGLRAAIGAQLHTLPHTLLAGCTHAPAVELAEALSARTGGALGHVFFASDGASAIEIALKMSFHAWRNRGRVAKRGFVSLRQGYHGETLGALHVTDVQVFRDAYDPLLLRSQAVMSPDARQAAPGESAADVAQRALDDLQAVLVREADAVAAVILEPMVQCAAGMAMHDAAFLRGVRALCDAYEVHLIADEIAVGCGRTGPFFAFEHAHAGAQPGLPPIWPDFICLSKGISGGWVPLSLVLTTDDIHRAFWSPDDIARGFLHSHSYTGNPLACAAAREVLRRFADTPLLADNARRAGWLGAAMAEVAAPWVADGRAAHVRQLGQIWAMDIAPAAAGERFAERMHLAGRRHGLLIRPIGGTVYLMPPYLLDEALAHELAGRVQATVQDVLAATAAARVPGAAAASPPASDVLAAPRGAASPDHADRTPEPPVA